MSTTLVYPDHLPTPQVAPYQPAERRVLSSSRPFQSRALQRDRLATQQITFPPMSIAQATDFRDWWRDLLAYGGNWFDAPKWPRPQGPGGVRRWLGTPRFNNVEAPSPYVRISGLCEVKGVGELPTLHTPTIWLLNEFVTTGGASGERAWQLSNGDQTAFVPDEAGSLTGVGNHYQGTIISNTPQSAGKRYFELVAEQIFAPNPIGFADTSISWGLVNSLFEINSGTNALGVNGSWAFLTTSTGECYFRGDDGAGGFITTGPLATLVEGMRFGFADDIEGGKIWVSVNGAWVTGDPETDTDPIVEDMTPAPFNIAFAAQRAWVRTTLRTIPADFSYPIPSGFVAWAD